jgi:nucleoside transporter
MTPGLRIRLSAMMFLEFFVWGAWFPALGVYLLKSTESGGLGLDAAQNGTIYGLLWLASIFMPLIAGQITDRIVPTQMFLAGAHLVGAIGLFLAARATSYGHLYLGILTWAIAYAPTISLTNSLAFSHLRNAEREFGQVRMFGTLGWIAAGTTLLVWRKWLAQPLTGAEFTGNDCLYLAAGTSVLMTVFCLALPHTPPARSGVSPFAFLKALSLLKNPRIAVFLVVCFLVGTELPFFFNLTPPFLVHLGALEEDVSGLMSIGQWAELFTMLALPWLLVKLGPRKTLFLGVLAWPARYLIFALGQPYELVVASIALHGLCFVCFFVVAFIYIDSVAPKDIKSSAQGLLTLVVYGFGMWLGSEFSSIVHEHFTATDKSVNWTGVFLVPSVLTIVCALVLFVTFPRGSMQEVSAVPDTPEAASA